MLDSFRSLYWLELILMNPKLALQSRLERPMGRVRHDFRQDHLVYYIAYFVLLLVSPYLWYNVLFGRLPSFQSLLLPPFLAILFLLLITVFDRFIEYRNSPTNGKAPVANPNSHNRALFLSIPVSASLFFFILHPLFGYLMLFGAIVYSVIQTVQSIAGDQQLSVQRVFALLISFCGVFLLPIVALLLIYNLVITSRILTTIF
ncbi:MAG: hypothetical protein H3C43_03815 [Leptonema sp. (in: Bacteria)]|nr:hypothetical protein [Leptonema sp. (in: bacteria)]